MPCTRGIFTATTWSVARRPALDGGPLDELLRPRRVRLERHDGAVRGAGGDHHQARPGSPRRGARLPGSRMSSPCPLLPSGRAVAAQAVARPAVPAPVARRAALERAHDEGVHRDPVGRRALLEPGLEALAEAQGDAGRQLVALTRRASPARLVLDVGHIDVVAGHPDVHAPVRQRGRQLGGGVGQEVEDAPRHRAAEHVGDPLGHLGHRLVARAPRRRPRRNAARRPPVTSS